LDNVVCRAVERRKPCNEKGEQLRDAILWESVKDITRETPEDRVALITGDSGDFASRNGILHPELATELQQANLHIDFFTSLDDFLKQYAVKIEFVTNSWLAGSIDFKQVLGQAGPLIAAATLDQLRTRVTGGDLLTGYCKMIDGHINVGNYYVYEMRDRSLRVEVILTGKVVVEIGKKQPVQVYHFEPGTPWPLREISGFEDLYDEDDEYDYSVPETFAFHRASTKMKPVLNQLYPKVELGLDLVVVEKQVKEWHLSDCLVSLDPLPME
jgi:hypothetical protein